MTGIGEDFYTPVMYQDLANPSMGMMPNSSAGMLGMGAMNVGGVGYPSYLNGPKMSPQVNEDKFIKHRKDSDKKDKSLFKKAMIIFAGCIALGCIKPCKNAIKSAGGLGKFVSEKWLSLKKWIKNLYNSNKP